MTDDFVDKHGFIDGIFDHITMEDFITTTSAVGVCDLATLDAQFMGAGAFDRFVSRQIETVRVSYAMAEGDINPVVILATVDTQYVFIIQGDETVGDFMERLRREATEIQATWTFIARKCMVGQADDGEDTDSVVGDEDVFRRAATRGRMKVGVLFYAQRKEGEETEHRQGYMHDDGEDNLGQVHMAIASQRTPLFDLLS